MRCHLVRNTEYLRHFEFVSVDASFKAAIEDFDAATQRAANQFRSVLPPTQTTDRVQIRNVLGFGFLPLTFARTPVVDSQSIVRTDHDRLGKKEIANEGGVK